ncbi:hypothetical protein A0J61_10863 [Choanephora cucurbitarum]|uniref:Uncharacterized protein n=1 Tax=Choanephora cucurbitarum TaxID=101091 RepID=A0A1C7MWE0_9FUNG|nr:hypothetical protein A0J61_10863 [Choanephora cucurbitarum]
MSVIIFALLHITLTICCIIGFTYLIYNSAESLFNLCIKTEENIVILKQEIAGLRQQMASFCEIVDRCNNILRQYSAIAGKVSSHFVNDGSAGTYSFLLTPICSMMTKTS